MITVQALNFNNIARTSSCSNAKTVHDSVSFLTWGANIAIYTSKPYTISLSRFLIGSQPLFVMWADG
jgi:hypothetical protein